MSVYFIVEKVEVKNVNDLEKAKQSRGNAWYAGMMKQHPSVDLSKRHDVLCLTSKSSIRGDNLFDVFEDFYDNLYVTYLGEPIKIKYDLVWGDLDTNLDTSSFNGSEEPVEGDIFEEFLSGELYALYIDDSDL